MAKRLISSRLEVICDADHSSLDIYYTTSWNLPRQYVVFGISKKEVFGYMAVGSDDVASRPLGLDNSSSFAFVPAPVSGSLVLHHLGSSATDAPLKIVCTHCRQLDNLQSLGCR